MAAGITYEPIATQTLSTATDVVTFSTISQAYTDLILVINGAKSHQTNTYIRFNGDTGSNYSLTNMWGDGSGVVSNRYSNVTFIYVDIASPAANTIHTKIVQINNYSNATTNKTVLIRDSSFDGEALASVGMWRNTSAITSISITNATSGYNWNVGSTFTIYGIAAA
jgi:hypothetical protein